MTSSGSIRPLDGIRVVDMAGLVGAYGTRLLAALGAEVIKVEPPGGSRLRHLGPFVEGTDAPENSLWWAYMSMGTRSVVLDAHTSSGRAELEALVRSADVVFNDEVAVDHEAILDDAPNIVWVSLTPFGLTGPKRDWSSSNLIAWAASGVLYTVGFTDQPPVAPGGPAQLVMHSAALNGAIGAMLGLRGRRLTGSGQVIDISLQEAGLVFAPETGVPVFLDDRVHRVRTGNRRELSRPFGIYPTSDGYVSILVLMPHHWVAFARWIQEVTGNDTAVDPVFEDMTVRGETKELVDSWVEELTTSMTSLEVFQEGQRRGIPITPVNTIQALMSDPHLDHVGYWQETDMPGGGTVSIPGAPFRTNANWWLTARAPRLGEHTEEILGVL